MVFIARIASLARRGPGKQDLAWRTATASATSALAELIICTGSIVFAAALFQLLPSQSKPPPSVEGVQVMLPTEPFELLLCVGMPPHPGGGCGCCAPSCGSKAPVRLQDCFQRRPIINAAASQTYHESRLYAVVRGCRYNVQQVCANINFMLYASG